ncbi:MAG: RNA polymerase sigma factor [Gemmataceae bacterium]
MTTPFSFAELIKRVRSGDQDAASDLVKRYEPAIRRAIRFRLTDARLGAVLDSMDICQSVMASFFLRAATGQFELEEPSQLQKLLVAMARNKLAMKARSEQAQKRDNRRLVGGNVEDQGVAATGASPSQAVSAKEMIQEAYKRLSDDERQIVELRNQGMEWSDIAKQLQASPEALRKKLGRALDRIAQELGVDDGMEG